MTVNKLPNQDDVTQQAKNIGFSTAMFNAQPLHVATQTGGGGAIGFGPFGALLNLSASSGNMVALQTMRRKGNPANFVGLSKVITTIVYSLDNSMTVDDGSISGTWQLGYPSVYGGVGLSNGGPILNLGGGTYKVGGTTQPAQTPEQNEVTVLTIVEDADNTSTTFHHRSQTFNETVELDNLVTGSGSGNVRGDHSGTGDEDRFYCQYIGVTMVPR